MSVTTDSKLSKAGEKLAITAILGVTFTTVGGLFTLAAMAETSQKEKFYASKPDQTNWPACTGKQVEWRNNCVPTTAIK